MQRKNQLLRAPDGEGRNDDLATALNGFFHEPRQFRVCVVQLAVQSVAVRAFDDKVVHIVNRLQRFQQRHSFATQVSAERQPCCVSIFRNLQNGDRGTQDVPRIKECRADPRHNVERAMVRARNQILNRLLRVSNRVERRDGRLLFARANLVDVLDIFFLNARAIAQHDRGEVTCGRCA